MNEDAEVVVQPEGKHVRIKVGQTVLEAARLAGVDLVSTCGGKGNCGKCRILCETGKDNVGSLTKIEQSLLSQEQISAGYRLACRTSVNRDVTVRIPEESRTGKQKLQTEGIRTHVKLDPLTRKYPVRLSVATLEDNRSDADRLLGKLRTEYHLKNLNLGLRVVQQLPSMLRKHDGDITVVERKKETIMGVELGNTTQRVFGYAIDIGTTKLAGYLIDLTTGEVVAADSLMNPQIPYGEDVIARIAFAMKGSREQKQLQQTLINGLNQILAILLEKSSVKRREVYEITVVGNTAMHHLFLNISSEGLALSPYAPAVRAGLDVSARAVGVKMNRNANVHVLPVVAGFVGADAVAVALATEIHKRNELCLALDIGTNTEIILGNKDNLMACSCGSGSALG